MPFLNPGLILSAGPRRFSVSVKSVFFYAGIGKVGFNRGAEGALVFM